MLNVFAEYGERMNMKKCPYHTEPRHSISDEWLVIKVTHWDIQGQIFCCGIPPVFLNYADCLTHLFHFPFRGICFRGNALTQWQDAPSLRIASCVKVQRRNGRVKVNPRLTHLFLICVNYVEEQHRVNDRILFCVKEASLITSFGVYTSWVSLPVCRIINFIFFLISYFFSIHTNRDFSLFYISSGGEGQILSYFWCIHPSSFTLYFFIYGMSPNLDVFLHLLLCFLG